MPYGVINFEPTHYYLHHAAFGMKEVTREEYIAAERQAGFYPKSNNPNDIATSGFGSNGMTGRTSYTQKV